jgi:hypothetical protein
MALVMAKLAFITVYCDGSTIGSLSSLRNATRLPFCSFYTLAICWIEGPTTFWLGWWQATQLPFPSKISLPRFSGVCFWLTGPGGLDSFFSDFPQDAEKITNNNIITSGFI